MSEEQERLLTAKEVSRMCGKHDYWAVKGYDDCPKPDFTTAIGKKVFRQWKLSTIEKYLESKVEYVRAPEFLAALGLPRNNPGQYVRRGALPEPDNIIKDGNGKGRDLREWKRETVDAWIALKNEEKQTPGAPVEEVEPAPVAETPKPTETPETPAERQKWVCVVATGIEEPQEKFIGKVVKVYSEGIRLSCAYTLDVSPCWGHIRKGTSEIHAKAELGDIYIPVHRIQIVVTVDSVWEKILKGTE